MGQFSQPEVCLASALLCWSSGWSIYDILMTSFGISHTNAIDSCHQLASHFTVMYPEDHKAQYAIADGFYQVLSADFGCCAGAIDGLLILIHKSLSKHCIKSVGCSNGRFFFGTRKRNLVSTVNLCVINCLS